MRWGIALIIFLTVCLSGASGDELILKTGTNSIRATIASTPPGREQGLKRHTHLCGNCGMLFVFPREGKYSFWMKDTPLPLSIAFIARDGRILNLEEMPANSTQSHTAQDNFLYALEMNKAWFTDHSIKVNDRIDGLQHSPTGR